MTGEEEERSVYTGEGLVDKLGLQLLQEAQIEQIPWRQRLLSCHSDANVGILGRTKL